MDVFSLRDDLVETYRRYATSFMRFRDDRVDAFVEGALESGMLWPHPSVGLNPSFEMSGYVDDLANGGLLHPRCREIFRLGKSEGELRGKQLQLRKHQADAVGVAAAGRNYVLTTGTGSGKSLAYIVPIVDHVLRMGSGSGVKALVVYPMNALVNSQLEELEKFLKFGPWNSPPVTFGRYTGQDNEETREQILKSPPDILLTNYVMLELVLTRFTDRRLVQAMKGLQFLVLDELHTYRGRQGADVAMLVRRLRVATESPNVRCVGTSATLSTEGDHESRMRRLAEMSSRLFGAPVEPSDIIGETLQRVTPVEVLSRPGFGGALTEATRRVSPPVNVEGFVVDPLSCWIENTFGVREEDGRLVRADPLPITGPQGAAKQLSSVTGVREDVCARAIRTYLLTGNTLQSPQADSPVFPFRLHQFISRGDTVYATPEPPSRRHLSLSGERFVADSDRQRVLLPLVFCRVCGQDYYMAHRQPTGSGSRLVRRDLNDNEPRDNLSPGFFYVSDQVPWPENRDRQRERLPPDWSDPRTGRLRPNRRDHEPQRMRVGSDGSVGAVGGTAGWWVSAPFRFCLACGVSHSVAGRNDFPRLSTLGAGGRASATTVMSLAAVQHLQDAPGLDSKARKLLSFTDNRQDASLQAGHFNDFIEVTMLRSALWRAVGEAGEGGVKHGELPGRVFEAMALPRESYAGDPDQHEIARQRTDRTMRKVLEYRLYRDFERGWRITQPNLEQVGLLRVDYENLPQLAAEQQTWDDCHAALVHCSPKRREHVLRVLLDYVRQELGLYVGVLHPAEQESLERNARQHLDGTWSLRGEKLLPATEMVTYPKDRRGRRHRRHVTSRSLFGRFLRRPDGLGLSTMDDTDLVIGQIVERLRRFFLLKQVGGGTRGREVWQVPAAALVWKAGDGTRPYRDYLRVTRAPEDMPTNRFFVELYRNSGDGLVGVEAREHTAQVSPNERIKREDRFRSAELPVLYCSPTMELGVDISLLNVVNMRNVPPTPANYAQRSGRAGRSGQPALVFTYCSSGNSHDQHFFRQQHKMVSGQVEAPRVDLANEDLLRAHVHAVWLATSGLSLGQSMSDILDMGNETGEKPVLKPQVWDALQDQYAIARARQGSRAILAGLEQELEGRIWWYDKWLDDVLSAIPARFNQALERWMALYMAALEQFRKQSGIAVSPSRSRQDQKRARRLRDEAERQLDVLRAKSDHRGQSDFYTYRYFASEGFLPGYSFPRLPLSAFIPGLAGRRDRGDYVQRPRFLAISEFGPQTYIYHEGARYQVNRVLLSSGTDTPQEDTAGLTVQAKRCDRCGYMHPVDDQTGQDICGYCGNQLGTPLTGLLQMRNVSTRYWERITSDEERRRRMGYELISGVEFIERQGRRSVSKATVLSGGGSLLELSYGDTATIWRVNLGWRRRKNKHDHGFYLDMERGEWSRSDSNNEPSVGENATTRKVVPFVKDSRNSLLVEPAEILPLETMASVAAALKAAIQVVFQLEPNELAVEPLPTRDDRRMLLVYESAEGGAGALRHLVDDPKWWQRIAEEGLRLCHTTPDSEDDADGGCGGACYECLLTYQNQLDHELLDRATATPVLRQLVDAKMKRHPSTTPRPESSLEEKFVDLLKTGGYRMPDRDQIHFPDARTRPDFLYNEACAAIYIDGPHHDYPDRAARDRDQEAAMLSLGYRTIRFHHQDEWDRIIGEHHDVFGAGHRTDSGLL